MRSPREEKEFSSLMTNHFLKRAIEKMATEFGIIHIGSENSLEWGNWLTAEPGKLAKKFESLALNY